MAQCPKSFAFIFPMASGHINPSLPVARALVELGHAVHYLCRDNMREAIEGTGAIFHSDVATETELYEGREADLFGAMESLKREHGMGEETVLSCFAKLGNVQLELQVPGVVRFLKAVEAQGVVYCPLMSKEAQLGAQVLGIPSVALLTTAGPGSLTGMFQEFLAMEQKDASSVQAEMQAFEPNMAAVRRLNEQFDLDVESGLTWAKPLGYLKVIAESAATIVTTSEDLQDPVTPELERKYQEEQVKFAFVGPLLDKKGAKRAVTHKNHSEAEGEEKKADAAVPLKHDDGAPSAEDLLAKVSAARSAGRRVVLVSMGTVLTGDAQLGWEGRLPGPDGQPKGLTGRELCRGAWAGAMDAFGAETAEEGPLLVMAVGPQSDPLGDLTVPPNAVCMPSVPQVDVLRAGVDLFLTHGGQNSFTESMAHGTPVVVCPGFGDQIVNSHKAVKLGVGCKVDRPMPDAGMEAEAAARYRADVCSALLEVSANSSFTEAAARCAQNLQQAGGVERAVKLCLAMATERVTPSLLSKTAAAEEPVTPSRTVLASAGA